MHIHTFLDLDMVQRVTTYPGDCDQCRHAANSLVDVRHCHCRPCILQRNACADYLGPTCEASLAFGQCYHSSCHHVAAKYDSYRRYVTGGQL